jgi:starch synthase
MRILIAAPEAYPFVSTGGLSGVTGSLPIALENAGHQVSLIIPFYRDAANLGSYDWIGGYYLTSAGEDFGMARTVLPGSSVEVYLVSKDEYFNRAGFYGPDSASGYPDNSARFSFFSRAVAAACENLGNPPDVLHCHDWQTGLAAAYLRSYRRPAVVFTIHSVHYQGNFAPEEFPVTVLPASLFSMDGLEFYGMFSCLKSGVVFADQVTTVSPTYAKEIQTPPYGEGLDGLFRDRAGVLTGILNGIDYGTWNPGDDPAIACSFTGRSLSRRISCRKDLAAEVGLDDPDGTMIAGIVSRLTGQKGLDLVFPLVDRMVGEGMSLVVLGNGEKRYMDSLRTFLKEHPGKIAARFGYDEGLARKIFAGCDLFLMPSRFEPCGLAQMMAMRYGAVPLVRKTGGLADTVTDVTQGGCGFVFEEADSEALLGTILRARRAFDDRKTWSGLVRRCMGQDNSWDSRVGDYVTVFEKALSARRGL